MTVQEAVRQPVHAVITLAARLHGDHCVADLVYPGIESGYWCDSTVDAERVVNLRTSRRLAQRLKDFHANIRGEMVATVSKCET